MKNIFFIFIFLFILCQQGFSKNEVTTVEQVTSAITLSDNLDYTITDSTTPFTATGSINITNTDHAVVILKNIRPSKALSYLGYININGEPAENDKNCQVRMYAEGSIIFPYSEDFKPLTVYSEQNFDGESVNDFGLEHTSGYMNTLTTNKLNNRIRSFKLKRGYMVTFSNNPSGRGYSRCFIADDADLEIAELPVVLDEHISSYRIFKWNDAQKKGLANDTGTEPTQALNVSWCYSFGPGEDKGIDCECVPHKIQVNWPGNCGTLTYSPHLKTNNEPGNSADHGTESVTSVLATWEDLMATGKRLCSPSSHDGSLNWLREFMDSIDARGWRCDILDMHCYWPEWNLNNALEGWYNDYKRPIWVSEFVWGASWNNNGIFATDKTYSIENQQKNLDVMSKVLTNWNSYPYIERYAYWNSEADCSKIYKDGGLSLLGEFYADMKTGLAYNKNYEFVPKVVYKSPSDLIVNYNEKTRKIEISWTNANMELTDSTELQLKIDDGKWRVVEFYPSSEDKSYIYSEIFPADFQKGTYTYRIHNYDSDRKQRYSEEISLSLSGAEGTDKLQYGHMEISDTEENLTYFNPIDGDAAVFVSLISNKNATAALVNDLRSINQTANTFNFKYSPWSYGGYSTTISRSEDTDFMVMSIGTHQYGNITMEVAETESRLTRDSTWITFKTPFPEGVTPVVIGSVRNTSSNNFVAKIWNITNEGFAVKLLRQAQIEDASATSGKAYLFYVAATPGCAEIENGEKLLTVGVSTDKIGGSLARNIEFKDNNDNYYTIINPYILCGSQTNNYNCASIYRIMSAITSSEEIEGEEQTVTTGLKVLRQSDKTATNMPTDNNTTCGDNMGWIIVSDNPKATAITDIYAEKPLNVSVEGRRIVVNSNEPYTIYNSNGTKMANDTELPRGLYIVKTQSQVTKVLINQ